jgi:DeoR/GlpR family transcriptional regulator of sugar metabolism
MHIFLSHSSKQKPLVREIKRYLPQYLGTWIDEEKLLFGDNISSSIEATIKSDTDYVLLFIDDFAAESVWVAKELDWTLQAEKTIGRTILLPIVIEEHALRAIPNMEIQNRKHLRLKDFLESSVRALSDAIASDLFALVCRDMDLLRTPKPKTASAAISEAEAFVRGHAALIQKAVFPHRRSNPISRETLREVVNSQSLNAIDSADFENVLSVITGRNLIPGLLYDGFELFLVEEHASWKSEIEHSKKERVGRKAAAFVQNGMKLLLDAGSTVDEVAKIICKKIETRSLTRIAIATTSINIADMVSDCCVKMGFDDDFSAVRLYLPGGRVRPNTQAIVPTMESEKGQLVRLAEALGRFDLSFVGVNGIDANGAFTTHGNEEAENKIEIMSAAARSIVVGDSSKIGISLECQFGELSEGVRLVTDDGPVSQGWLSSLGELSSLVVLA